MHINYILHQYISRDNVIWNKNRIAVNCNETHALHRERTKDDGTVENWPRMTGNLYTISYMIRYIFRLIFINHGTYKNVQHSCCEQNRVQVHHLNEFHCGYVNSMKVWAVCFHQNGRDFPQRISKIQHNTKYKSVRYQYYITWYLFAKTNKWCIHVLHKRFVIPRFLALLVL